MINTSRLPISACLIVRDEADVLARCLASIVNIVEEIIVVDTGSLDLSPAIASSYGAAVYHSEWREHFAEARNLSLSLANQPWILVLDADEVLDEQAWQPDIVIPLLQVESVQAYYVRMTHLMDKWRSFANRPAAIAVDMACRLFRRDSRIQFTGRIHEEVTTSIQAFASTATAVRWSQLNLWHDGYSQDTIQQKGKLERNLHLISKQLDEEPSNPRWWYAYGTECFQIERYQDAIPWFMKTLAQLSELELLPGYASDVWIKTIYAMYRCGQLQSATELAAIAVEMFPNFPDLLQLTAEIHSVAGQYTEALHFALLALSCGDVSHLYSVSEALTPWNTHWIAAYAAEQLDNAQLAYIHYREAALHYPGKQRYLLNAASLAISGNAVHIEQLIADHSSSCNDPRSNALLHLAASSSFLERTQRLHPSLQLPSQVRWGPLLQALLK